MKIAVSGGSGFVGSHLVPALVSRGHKVRLLMRTEANPSDGVSHIVGSISSKSVITRFLEGSDIIINLIGRFDPPFEEQIESNVIAPLELFSNAGRMGIKRVIHISAAAVYGDSAIKKIPTENDPTDPTTSYSLSKVLGEEVLEFCKVTYGILPVILRPTNIYGPDSRVGVLQSMKRSSLEDGMISITGDGEQVRDFIHVEDLVSAIVSIVEKPMVNPLYNVASGEAMTLNDLARIFISSVKKPIHIKYTEEAKGYVRVLRADNSRLINDYAWKPRYTIRDTIAEILKK